MRIQNRRICLPWNATTIYGPAIRYQGQVYVGGQDYNAEPDERAWVESRLIYNEDREYKGYWAMRNIPPRSTAGELSVDGATYFDTVGGGILDSARIPENTPTTARWSLTWPGHVTGAVAWETDLRRATDGFLVARLFSTGNNGSSVALPSLPPGSYLLHTRPRAAAKAYVWPPPDYEAITKKKPDDPTYAWEHPTIGPVFYNPYYHVGLMPFDPEHPLAQLRDEAIATGQAVKVAEWVSLVTMADAQGNYVASGGEYSSLRLVVGAGAWLGDQNVAWQATAAGPCVWRVEDPGPNGIPVPVMIDPTARIGGAFYGEPEDGGGLWVGLMVAGRSGRVTRLVRMAPDATLGGGGVVKTDPLFHGGVLFCECALSNESINTITRYPDRPLAQGGQLHALTFCSRLLLRPDAPADQRLEETHPGGRSLTVIRVPGSDGFLVYHTESDFAVSKNWEWGFNFMLGDSPRGIMVGPPSAHHNYDNLAAYQGAAYYVSEDVGKPGTLRYAETGEDIADNRQYLTRYTSGDGVRLANWKTVRYDLGALSPAGPNLVVTGETGGVPGVNMRPAAMRLAGASLEASDYWPVWVRRIQPSLTEDGQRQVALMTGYLEDRVNPGRPLAGSYVYETTGEEAVVRFCFSDGALRVELEELEAQGYYVDELPDFLAWNQGELCWSPATEQPAAGVYLRLVGIAYYLEGGAWPYDLGEWPCIELRDLEGCWPRVRFDCSSLLDCYEGFPEGSTVGFVEVAAAGELYNVFAGGYLRDAEGNALGGLREHYANYPPAFWLAVDVPTPIPLAQGGSLEDPTVRAALAPFTTRAGLYRYTPLPKPARRNAVLAYIIPPGTGVAMALAPR